MKKNNLIVICGPTAIGKTDIAIEVAKKLRTEIISADSRQFYREMSIGTAKPDESQLAAVRHHLVGHISVRDPYNVSRFEQDALKVLEEILNKNTYAILCGGSGLYIDALCEGIDDLPDADEKLRNDLKDQLKKKGIESLQQMLKELDPEYFIEVDQNNPKRLMRAIEVCVGTGRKYSELRKKKPKERAFDIIKIGLNTDRINLFKRIHLRTDQMIKEGLVDEVRQLIPYRDLNALNTVGYKEIFQYLGGKLSLEEAIEKIKVNTRRYAKRQLTWFRKDPDIHWFEPQNLHDILQFISTIN